MSRNSSNRKQGNYQCLDFLRANCQQLHLIYLFVVGSWKSSIFHTKYLQRITYFLQRPPSRWWVILYPRACLHKSMLVGHLLKRLRPWVTFLQVSVCCHLAWSSVCVCVLRDANLFYVTLLTSLYYTVCKDELCMFFQQYLVHFQAL